MSRIYILNIKNTTHNPCNATVYFHLHLQTLKRLILVKTISSLPTVHYQNVNGLIFNLGLIKSRCWQSFFRVAPLFPEWLDLTPHIALSLCSLNFNLTLRDFYKELITSNLVWIHTTNVDCCCITFYIVILLIGTIAKKLKALHTWFY